MLTTPLVPEGQNFIYQDQHKADTFTIAFNAANNSIKHYGINHQAIKAKGKYHILMGKLAILFFAGQDWHIGIQLG